MAWSIGCWSHCVNLYRYVPGLFVTDLCVGEVNIVRLSDLWRTWKLVVFLEPVLCHLMIGEDVIWNKLLQLGNMVSRPVMTLSSFTDNLLINWIQSLIWSPHINITICSKELEKWIVWTSNTAPVSPLNGSNNITLVSWWFWNSIECSTMILN